MVGELKELIRTHDGKQIITIVTESDFSDEYDALFGSKVDFDIKKHHEKRSNEANAYCWVLIDKLASRMSVTKKEVYRNAIRSIGGVSDFVCVKEEAFDKFKAVWCVKGLGYQVDKLPSKLEGCVTAVVYYGSSTYDGPQMSRLIDNLVQDCKAIGIPTETPEQIAKMKALWADKKGN